MGVWRSFRTLFRLPASYFRLNFRFVQSPKPFSHLTLILLLFLTHQFTQKVLHLPVPWADNYLDTLLCMPILLAGYRLEQRWLLGRRRLSLFEVLAITALLSFVFEYLFPRFSSGFTADCWDVAAYFAGTLAFYLFQKE